MEVFLTLSRRRPLSYRNQSIDLLRKSMDWFLYDNGLRLERVKVASDIFNSRSRRDCTNNTITIFFLLWFFRTYIFPTTCCTSCTRSFLFIWLDEWPNDFTIRRFKVKTFYYFSILIDQLFTQICRHHRNFDHAGYFQATLDKRRSSTICRPQRCFDSCATIQKKFSYTRNFHGKVSNDIASCVAHFYSKLIKMIVSFMRQIQRLLNFRLSISSIIMVTSCGCIERVHDFKIHFGVLI